MEMERKDMFTFRKYNKEIVQFYFSIRSNNFVNGIIYYIANSIEIFFGYIIFSYSRL